MVREQKIEACTQSMITSFPKGCLLVLKGIVTFLPKTELKEGKTLQLGRIASFLVKSIPCRVQFIIKQSVVGTSLAYFSRKAMEPLCHDFFRPTPYQAQDWHHLCGQGLVNAATVMAPSGWWVSIPGDHIYSQNFFCCWVKVGRVVLYFPLGSGRVDLTPSKLSGLVVVFVLLAMRKEMGIWVGLTEECRNCGLCEYAPSKEPGVTLGECKENVVDVRGKMGGKSKVLEKYEEKEKAEIYNEE